MSVSDKLLLRKRAITETINDELKNIAQVEHSRHRCFDNFRSYCCILYVSEKAVYQCTEDIGYTACSILNSSTHVKVLLAQLLLRASPWPPPLLTSIGLPHLEFDAYEERYNFAD